MVISATAMACGLLCAAIGFFIDDMSLLAFGGIIAISNALIINYAR